MRLMQTLLPVGDDGRVAGRPDAATFEAAAELLRRAYESGEPVAFLEGLVLAAERRRLLGQVSPWPAEAAGADQELEGAHRDALGAARRAEEAAGLLRRARSGEDVSRGIAGLLEAAARAGSAGRRMAP